MPKKNKRRGGQPARTKQPDQPAASSEAAGDPAAAERRAQQIREWEKRKREKERPRRSLAPFLWGGSMLGLVAATGLAVVLLAGGDDDSSPVGPSATPDRRVAGLPIDETFTVEADDDGQAINPIFVPNTITAEAGQVIEIVVPNIGSVAHNLRLAGLDGEYEPDAPGSDDWITDPATIEAGEEGRVVVKIDQPGSYPFRCDFHALQQIGTLILTGS